MRTQSGHVLAPLSGKAKKGAVAKLSRYGNQPGRRMEAVQKKAKWGLFDVGGWVVFAAHLRGEKSPPGGHTDPK